MNSRLKPAVSRSKDESGGINLKRMLRLRMPLIAVVFAALAIPGTAAVWKLIPLTYKASADVRFLASTPRVMGRDNRESTVPYDKFLNTQVSLITGNAVLSQMLQEPEVRSLPLIADKETPLDFLKEAIKAEAQPNSELVTISCTLPDREAAKLLVDKALSAYMTYALSEEADTGGERLRVLMKERDSRQADLDSQLRQISELQQKVETPISSATTQGVQENKAYQEPHARAEEDVSRAGSKTKLLNGQIDQVNALFTKYKASPGKPVFEMGAEDKVAVDPRVVAARQEFIKADAEFAATADRYGDKSPQLEVERGKINALKSRMAQTEQTVRGEVIASMLALLQKDLGATQSEMEDAQTRKAGFEGLIEQDRARTMEASKVIAAMDELKIHAEETRTQLRAVREEITSITVESNAPARVKLAAPPSVPTSPGFGKRLQMLFLLLMLSGAAGLGAGLLRELTDQQIRSAQDIASVTDNPVLALIPHSGGEVPALPAGTGSAGESRGLILHANKNGLRRQRRATAVAERPDTAVGNEFRKVLASIVSLRDIADPEGAVGAIMVTSPVAGDGKTLVACNLAITLTQANRKVLMVEVSPKGDLEEVLGMEPGCGLTDVLFGGMPLLEAVRSTAFEGLYVLGAGSEPERLTMKMASREMVALIHSAKLDFDHVVIDTPPVLAMADAGLLAAAVDGVVLVAGAGVSRLGMVRQASVELNRLGANVLGVVLNCALSSFAPPMPGVRHYEAYQAKKRVTPAAQKARDERADSEGPAPGGTRNSADNPRLIEVHQK